MDWDLRGDQFAHICWHVPFGKRELNLEYWIQDLFQLGVFVRVSKAFPVTLVATTKRRELTSYYEVNNLKPLTYIGDHARLTSCTCIDIRAQAL